MQSRPDNATQAASARRIVYPAATAGRLRFVRGWHLVSPNTQFGGFSALARLGPGRFQLVGDNGYVTRLSFDAAGRIVGVAIVPLPRPGRHYPPSKRFSDAEALVVDRASGKSWVAFEGINQVWRLDSALRHVETRRHSAPLARWPANSGPEAMARLPDGRTVIFSEYTVSDPRGTEALVYTDDPAAAGRRPLRFFYDAEGKGQISDAVPLPDGRLLILHRRLGFDRLFTSILAIADPADIVAGGVLRSRTLGTVPRALADNFEGVAVADPVTDGRTRLWLVADDNFNRWQRSLLLEFELVD